MRRIVLGLVILGAFFGAGLGLHAGLVAVSKGDTGFAERAQATCAACHFR
jgi:hypothetical protein